MRNKQLLTVFILVFISFSLGYSQKLVNSPYARFNLGCLNPQGSFRSLAMGGTGLAQRDNSSIYNINAASYTSLDTSSFVFDFGLDYSIGSLTDGVNTFKSGDLNFHHLIMGFPVGKRIGVSTGISSLSNGYYYLSETITSSDPEYNPVTGEIASVHKGSGSLSNFLLGAGIELTKNLSAGVNFNVITGEISRINQYEFGDYANTFTQKGSENFRISGISLDYGLQYSRALKKEHFLTAGLSFALKNNVGSTLERMTQRFSVYNAPPYSPDTLIYSKIQSKDSTSLPSSVRAGLAFGKKDKFVVEVDYIITNWDEASIQGNYGNTLASTQSLMLGLEYIPDMYSNNSFLKRIEYRLGGHYADNYLKIGDTQLKEYGVSCGLGIRLRGTYSKASLYFDYTRRQGDTGKGLHNENIYSVGASLNLYDFWFVKRKYH